MSQGTEIEITLVQSKIYVSFPKTSYADQQNTIRFPKISYSYDLKPRQIANF